MSTALKQRVAELRFPSRPDRLGRVREFVRHTAKSIGCDAELTEQVALAVNEACMNIIQHAYGMESTGEIILEIFNSTDRIQIRLQDFAPPVDIEKIRSRELDEIRPGGLGMHFISEIMDDFEIGHLDGEQGNYLEMSKRIT